MKKMVLALLLMCAATLVACGGNQPKPVTDEKELENTSLKPAAQPSGGGYGSQPSSPVASTPNAPAGSSASGAPPAGPEVEKPAELVELEKTYEKNPKDEATKKKLVQATYEFGRKINYDNGLAPRVKYPQALRLFRKVLELDPAHQQAAAEKKQIEDIYVSMGRPI
ncbi:MAG: hypothetical protein AB1489_20340, partial [Acidobacteriota bacterium]